MKVKNYLFAAASAALLLSSCSNSDVVEMPSGRAIGFGTYVSNTARAAVDTDLDFLKGTGAGFYVFGDYDKDGTLVNVFDGKSTGSLVEWKTSSWAYAPINYWHDGFTYKFAAYGPAAANGNGTASFDYNTNKLKIADYVSDGAVDLVVAEGDNAGYKPLEANTKEEPVAFKFFHALSKVKFTIVNGWRNDVTLTVNGMKLSGVNSKGTFETTSTLNGASAPAVLTWTSSDPKVYDDTGAGLSSDVYTDEYEFVNFLIPQTLSEDVLTLTFTAKVTNASGSGPDLGAGPGNAVTKVVTIPVDVVSSWESGKAYNYKLTVSGETFGLKPIVFDNITVESWGDTDIEDNLTVKDIKSETV